MHNLRLLEAFYTACDEKLQMHLIVYCFSTTILSERGCLSTLKAQDPSKPLLLACSALAKMRAGAAVAAAAQQAAVHSGSQQLATGGLSIISTLEHQVIAVLVGGGA